MSLTAIKQKETKGKKNVLPKLRTILANPYKQHCPVLSENEMLDFGNLLKAAINESGHTQKTFVTQAHIQLGLESSLRAINGRRFSCVFISLSLRPSHLVRLIATTAAVKVPTAPIYAQPKLEELTHELLGVRALALVLPLDLKSISAELSQWVEARMKSVAPRKTIISPSKTVKRRKPKEQELNTTLVEPQVTTARVEKEWSGDYISCLSEGAVLKMDQADVQTETKLLDAALTNLAKKAKTNTKVTEFQENLQKTAAQPAIEHMDIETPEAVDDDEFLPTDLSEYQPLTVHQIRANPDKKPKKKRNKNKKQKNQPPQNKTN